MRIVIVLAAALVLAAGCTGETRSPTGAPQVAPAQKQAAPDTQAAPGAAPSGQQAVVPERKLARTAQLSLVAGDVGAVVAQARRIAADAGGFSGSARTDETSATVSVTVPNDALDAVVGRFSALGKVTSSQQTVADVTEQVADVDSRLANARASVDRVRALFGRAADISDITSIEAQLTSRESDLEALQARHNALASSVAMSTLTITVTPAPVATVVQPEPGFLDGLAAGWREFLNFGRNAVHLVGVALPFVVVLGVPLAALGWLLRRKRKATADAKATKTTKVT